MTVFILGAGVMQLPALEAARELGWKVGAADGNPAAPGASSCDLFFPVDLKDGEGLLMAARRLRELHGLHAIFTAGTDFSAMVAFLAEELGLPGHRLEAARAASDKLLMRARFEAAGLSSPRFAEIGETEAQELGRTGLGRGSFSGLKLPLVVKPTDNMGARGCRLARDEAELLEAIELALPLSRRGKVIVEEYIEGPEFSIDSLIYDGKLRIRGFADRQIHFAPYFVELGHSLPTVASKEIQEEVLEVFEAGVRCLGLSHGAAKGDMKWCPARGRPVIGEIAARLSGGYMSGWTWPYASGHELTRDALLLAAGLRPPEAFEDRGWTSTERAFISIPGRVAAIQGLRRASASPYIKELFLRVRPGDEVVFPTNNVEKCGNLISQAPDHELAVSAAEEALGGILVRLEAPQSRTEDFLGCSAAGKDPRWPVWPPPAFSLDAERSALISGLPERLPGPPPPGPRAVLSLPSLLEAGGRDWSGRSLAQSAELALSLGGGRLVEASSPEASGALAKRFWSALVRGGAQAALYVLDAEGAR